ncbi:translation initiation factor eIF-2B subunit epsilon, partial [Phenoliferia sp. Uapishka_3]
MSKAALAKEDTKQEHPLQAVVLCDPYGEEDRWAPLVRTDDYEDGHEERPWVRSSTSMLAGCTASADGVEEIFIFVNEGVTQVRDYLSSSTFLSVKSPLSITVRPTTALTPGDVLREVDSLQILAPADFIVVQAGYVGNINLADLVKEFGERRSRDPYLVMSCVVAKRTGNEEGEKWACHVTEGSDDRLVHYEESKRWPGIRHATLPREALDGCKEVKTRVDLEAVGVAICSIEVPPLFTENFDYQHFYPDFVNGILTSDLLGKTICATIVGEGEVKSAWAGVVGNTRSYDLVRTCTVSSTSLVGSHSAIGASSTIRTSVLSPHVTVGSSSSISGSYIFHGAKIGDDCVIRDSIVGEDAVIGSGSVLHQGTLVGRGVQLGKGARLEGERVSRIQCAEEVNGREDSTLGEGHAAFFWPSYEEAPESDDEDDEDPFDPRNHMISKLGAQLSTLHLASSSSSLSSLSRSSSTTSLSTLASASGSGEVVVHGIESLSENPSTSKADFESECLQSLERSFAEDHTVDNASIELKTLRMASNVPLGQVRDVVVPFVLAKASDATKVPALIKRWGGLIESLTGEQEDAMRDTLISAQKFAASREGEDKHLILWFQRVLKAFYEEDIVSDDAVFAWYKFPLARTVGGEKGRKLWVGAKPFIEALAEDSDEEDESD